MRHHPFTEECTVLISLWLCWALGLHSPFFTCQPCHEMYVIAKQSNNLRWEAEGFLTAGKQVFNVKSIDSSRHRATDSFWTLPLCENLMQKVAFQHTLESNRFENASVTPEARCVDWQAAGTVHRHIFMSGSYSSLHTSLIKSGLPKAGIFTPVSLSRYLLPLVCTLQTEGVKCSLTLSAVQWAQECRSCCTGWDF